MQLAELDFNAHMHEGYTRGPTVDSLPSTVAIELIKEFLARETDQFRQVRVRTSAYSLTHRNSFRSGWYTAEDTFTNSVAHKDDPSSNPKQYSLGRRIRETLMGYTCNVPDVQVGIVKPGLRLRSRYTLTFQVGVSSRLGEVKTAKIGLEGQLLGRTTVGYFPATRESHSKQLRKEIMNSLYH